MTYSHEVERMCPLTKGPNHGPAPIPEEGQWVKAYQISDISGLTHGVGWCAPQQGTCKLTLNVKKGVIEEALVEQALEAFYWLRGLRDIEKKPSTSELVDWLRALAAGGVDPQRITEKIPYAGVLLKKDKDLRTLARNQR